MNVSDDVEGSVVASTVDPQRLANDCGCLHGFDRVHDIDVAESLPLEASHRALHLVSLGVNHARWQVSIRATTVPLDTQLLWEIEDDGDREAVVVTAEGDKRLARFSLNARRVDDDDPPRSQPFARYELEHAKRGWCGSNISLVHLDHSSAPFCGDHLRRLR